VVRENEGVIAKVLSDNVDKMTKAALMGHPVNVSMNDDGEIVVKVITNPWDITEQPS